MIFDFETMDKRALETHPDDLATFWAHTPEAVCAALRCGIDGLASADADRRLAQYGPNSDAQTITDSLSRAIFRRLLEPLSLILLAAGIVSVATGDAIGGSIIVAILALSIGLDTVQEGHAVRAAAVLRRSVALKAEVKRDGTFLQIEVDKVVPGDIASGLVTSSPPTHSSSTARLSQPARRPSRVSLIRSRSGPARLRRRPPVKHQMPCSVAP